MINIWKLTMVGETHSAAFDRLVRSTHALLNVLSGDAKEEGALRAYQQVRTAGELQRLNKYYAECLLLLELQRIAEGCQQFQRKRVGLVIVNSYLRRWTSFEATYLNTLSKKREQLEKPGQHPKKKSKRLVKVSQLFGSGPAGSSAPLKSPHSELAFSLQLLRGDLEIGELGSLGNVKRLLASCGMNIESFSSNLGDICRAVEHFREHCGTTDPDSVPGSVKDTDRVDTTRRGRSESVNSERSTHSSHTNTSSLSMDDELSRRIKCGSTNVSDRFPLEDAVRKTLGLKEQAAGLLDMYDEEFKKLQLIMRIENALFYLLEYVVVNNEGLECCGQYLTEQQSERTDLLPKISEYVLSLIEKSENSDVLALDTSNLDNILERCQGYLNFRLLDELQEKLACPSREKRALEELRALIWGGKGEESETLKRYLKRLEKQNETEENTVFDKLREFVGWPDEEFSRIKNFLGQKAGDWSGLSAKNSLQRLKGTLERKLGDCANSDCGDGSSGLKMLTGFVTLLLSGGSPKDGFQLSESLVEVASGEFLDMHDMEKNHVNLKDTRIEFTVVSSPESSSTTWKIDRVFMSDFHEEIFQNSSRLLTSLKSELLREKSKNGKKENLVWKYFSPGSYPDTEKRDSQIEDLLASIKEVKEKFFTPLFLLRTLNSLLDQPDSDSQLSKKGGIFRRSFRQQLESVRAELKTIFLTAIPELSQCVSSAAFFAYAERLLNRSSDNNVAENIGQNILGERLERFTEVQPQRLEPVSGTVLSGLISTLSAYQAQLQEKLKSSGLGHFFKYAQRRRISKDLHERVVEFIAIAKTVDQNPENTLQKSLLYRQFHKLREQVKKHEDNAVAKLLGEANFFGNWQDLIAKAEKCLLSNIAARGIGERVLFKKSLEAYYNRLKERQNVAGIVRFFTSDKSAVLSRRLGYTEQLMAWIGSENVRGNPLVEIQLYDDVYRLWGEISAGPLRPGDEEMMQQCKQMLIHIEEDIQATTEEPDIRAAFCRYANSSSLVGSAIDSNFSRSPSLSQMSRASSGHSEHDNARKRSFSARRILSFSHASGLSDDEASAAGLPGYAGCRKLLSQLAESLLHKSTALVLRESIDGEVEAPNKQGLRELFIELSGVLEAIIVVPGYQELRIEQLTELLQALQPPANLDRPVEFLLVIEDLLSQPDTKLNDKLPPQMPPPYGGTFADWLRGLRAKVTQQFPGMKVSAADPEQRMTWLEYYHALGLQEVSAVETGQSANHHDEQGLPSHLRQLAEQAQVKQKSSDEGTTLYDRGIFRIRCLISRLQAFLSEKEQRRSILSFMTQCYQPPELEKVELMRASSLIPALNSAVAQGDVMRVLPVVSQFLQKNVGKIPDNLQKILETWRSETLTALTEGANVVAPRRACFLYGKAVVAPASLAVNRVRTISIDSSSPALPELRLDGGSSPVIMQEEQSSSPLTDTFKRVTTDPSSPTEPVVSPVLQK